MSRSGITLALATIGLSHEADGHWRAHLHYRGSRIAPGAPLVVIRPTRQDAYDAAKRVLHRYGYVRHTVH